MGKKILLTGGSGFIGRNIIEQIGSKHEITAPGHSELDLLNTGDVERFIQKGGFDTVIHAANIGGGRKNPSPANLVETNLRMFFNIARCSGSFGKLIQLGSGAEYGKQADIMRAKESGFGARIPADPYGFYKYACSKYIEGAENMTCLRIFGCYGKYEDYEYKFISNAICRSLFGMPITINNKNVVFSYLFIDDFVKIVDRFISHKGKHKFYNAVPDETADIISIAKIVSELTGKKSGIEVKNPGLGLEYTGDGSRLKAELGKFRFTAMKEGIGKLHAWYEKNLHLIKKERLGFTG